MTDKEYFIETDEYLLPVSEATRKQIISDHLEKYYISSLVLGSFLVGFLLGVLAYAL